jgi:hypothetical protein
MVKMDDGKDTAKGKLRIQFTADKGKPTGRLRLFVEFGTSAAGSTRKSFELVEKNGKRYVKIMKPNHDPRHDSASEVIGTVEYSIKSGDLTLMGEVSRADWAGWNEDLTQGVTFKAGAATISLTEAASEVSTDVAKSREVASGNVRVVLLRVGQVIDFTGDAKKPADKSIEVLAVVELLEGDKVEPSLRGLEVFAAGSTEPAVRFLTDNKDVTPKWGAAVESYAEHEKKKTRKLPAVEAKDRAFVVRLVVPNCELTAKKLDLKMQLEFPKNKGHIIWFKGISI